MAPAVVQSGFDWPRSLDAVPDWLGRFAPLSHYLAVLVPLLALAGAPRRLAWPLALAAALALPELFYVSRYGIPSGPHVYGVLADADTGEVLSFVGPWWWLALGAWLLTFGVSVLAALRLRRVGWHWRHRSRLWVLVAAALVLAGAVVDHRSQRIQLTSIDALNVVGSGDMAALELAWRDQGFESRLRATYPWGLPWRAIDTLGEMRDLDARRRAAGTHDFGTRRVAGAAADASPAPELHLLVIGESAWSARWGLFGAPRPTTPLLSARRDLVVFPDAVSAASATRESVPLMLSRRPVDDPLALRPEPSVITAFRQAGFRTHWLTTQGSLGGHDTPLSVLAKEADDIRYLNPADYHGHGAYDGALLAPLRAVITDRAAARRLVVLHTLGSHLNYAHRYPPAFERFQPALPPDSAPDAWSRAQAVELTNAYDNSVLYTDWLLSELIGTLERHGGIATLTYVADHGESLTSGPCRRAGHGFPALCNYRVPMLMWVSPAWAERHAAPLARLKARARTPVSTLATFPTLLALADLEIAQASAYPSLDSPAPQPAVRRVLHFGDFDEGVLRLACDPPTPASPSDTPTAAR